MACVFCEIAAGSAPAYFIYRSQRVIAFLDIYPVEKGHTLVTPLTHYRDLLEVPDDLLAEIIRVVKAVAAAQLRSLGASGVRVVQNNGSAAGQVVFHVHFHVIPFYTHGVSGRRALKPDEGEAISRMLAEALRVDDTKGIS
ncbi:MAG: HIT family protein [Thermofilaceae archaeon]|nr:HIT family protein [Thermofilaceae archaeon]MDW8004581.1 HIT family protein [Thermofilaceae archaeon]